MQDHLLDIDDELLKLVRQAINTGFAQVQDEEEDTDILPALITDTAIIVLEVQKPNDIFTTTQDLLASGIVKRGVLIYSGYLTLRGERTRVIFAEGYEQGKDKTWRFAQVYRPAVKAGFLRKAQQPERLGNLKFLTGPAEYRFPS
jgi:hypothetical protein